jgi:ubiquinone/menaquinone biosynthesis C-methylase UbiE
MHVCNKDCHIAAAINPHINLSLRATLLLLLIFSLTTVAAQQRRMQPYEMDSVVKARLQITIHFLHLQPTDSIADVGSGSGYSLIPIANTCPECRFTVQDIDSNTCNTRVWQKRILQSGGFTRIENFSFQTGTEQSTRLPTAAFNKVLVFDVIHELTYKTEMLADLKRILAPGGSLFIEEILVHQPQKKDRACNYPFLTEPEFITLMNQNGFVLKKQIITLDPGKNKYFKCFEWVLS